MLIHVVSMHCRSPKCAILSSHSEPTETRPRPGPPADLDTLLGPSASVPSASPTPMPRPIGEAHSAAYAYAVAATSMPPKPSRRPRTARGMAPPNSVGTRPQVPLHLECRLPVMGQEDRPASTVCYPEPYRLRHAGPSLLQSSTWHFQPASSLRPPRIGDVSTSYAIPTMSAKVCCLASSREA